MTCKNQSGSAPVHDQSDRATALTTPIDVKTFSPEVSQKLCSQLIYLLQTQEAKKQACFGLFLYDSGLLP